MRLAFFLFFGMALASCGNLCLGPIGNQEACYGTQSGSNSGATASTLSIVVPALYTSQPIPASTAVSLRAANGLGTYTWQIVGYYGTTGTLSTGTTTGSGPYTASTITYNSPASGTTSATIVQLSDGTTTTALAFTTR